MDGLRVKVSGVGDGMRAGLTLRFDDGDWLTITTDHAGAVQICPSVNHQIGACQSTQVSFGADGALWLDLTWASGRFFASTSADGANWKQSGSWSAPAPKTDNPQSGSQESDPSRVWLPFTSAGLLVTGAPDVTGAPVFASLTVDTASQRIRGG
jgi:hypothetical protein